MGSFTELTVALTFSTETPAEVIGAFAQWRVPQDERAPELTTPDVFAADLEDDFEIDDEFERTSELFDRDPAQLAPLEQAALWRYLIHWTYNGYFPGTPSTALRWGGEAWTLTIRALPKAPGGWVQEAIAPLGRWAHEGTPDRPWFAGYMLDEYNSRPVLIWSVRGQPFRFEGEFANR